MPAAYWERLYPQASVSNHSRSRRDSHLQRSHVGVASTVVDAYPGYRLSLAPRSILSVESDCKFPHDSYSLCSFLLWHTGLVEQACRGLVWRICAAPLQGTTPPARTFFF
jgi:hypothetical protein